MRTSTLVGLSAIAWVGGAIAYDQPLAAAIFAVGHVLFWQNHALEVKINRLLNERGLFVGDADVNN